MGQKVHPYGFRLGYIKGWHSSWYAKDRYAELLHEDLKMRTYIEKNMKSAAVASIDISRTSDQVKVTVNTAKPGIAIGKREQESKRSETILRK